MRIPLVGVLMLVATATSAADPPRAPRAVLNSLADQIYVAGETSGKAEVMVAAEEEAADEIRQYIAAGLTDGLLAKEKGKQSPLAAAAYMGYPNAVAALLTSPLVVAQINDADETGVTPWIASTLSMRQSLWACNPTVLEDPLRIVPMLVTQPYYLTGAVPPYWKVREVLEKAGASTDVLMAMKIWLTPCKRQSDETRAKVQASTDLQKTVQELGAVDWTSRLMRRQKQSADAPQAH